MPRTGQTAFRAVRLLVRDWDGIRRQHQDLIADLSDQLVDSQEAYLAHYRAQQGRYQHRILEFPTGRDESHTGRAGFSGGLK